MPIEWSYDVLTYLILFMCTRVTSFQQTKVSVQPHPSAVNMTLLTFAAECRRLLHGAIDWYLPTQHSAANPPHVTAAFDRWDRQTDGRTLNRFVDSARHTMWQCHNQIKYRYRQTHLVDLDCVHTTERVLTSHTYTMKPPINTTFLVKLPTWKCIRSNLITTSQEKAKYSNQATVSVTWP